jgi:hypothetical protein
MSNERDDATARARWLAEVGDALQRAQQLTTQLEQWHSGSPEAVILRVRIMAVRAEVDALQRSRKEPKWSKYHAPQPDRIHEASLNSPWPP